MLPKDDADWTPCSGGALSATIKRIRSKRRQANMLRFGANGLAGALVLFAASFYFSLDSADLECHQVGGLLARYVAGDLDRDSRQFVEQHLAGCEECREKLRELSLTAWATPRSLSPVKRGPLGTVKRGPLSTVKRGPMGTRLNEDLLLSAIQPVPLAID